MKTTLENAITAMRVITRLNAVRTKSTATARKLFSLKKLLEPNFEFYAAEEAKLVEEIGGTVAPDGMILFTDQQEGMKRLTEGRAELTKTEVEIPIDTPVIFHDAEGVQVSGEEIGILEGLAEFKE